MNTKGIEFRTINFIPSQIQKDFRKNQPVIKPVEKIDRSVIWSDIKKTVKGFRLLSEFSPSEEDARLASEIMSEYLQESSELESDWKYDRENNMLVIEIKNKLTGQVLRQIPPEEILSGAFVPEKDANGNIINKIA